jgi:glucose uptake protein GlcU
LDKVFGLIVVILLIAGIVVGLATSGERESQRTAQLRYEAMIAHEQSNQNEQFLSFLMAGVVVTVAVVGGFSLVGLAYLGTMAYLERRRDSQPKVIERIIERRYLYLPPGDMSRRELWQLAARNGYEPMVIEAKSRKV